jgi:Uma2 family endonuclease
MAALGEPLLVTVEQFQALPERSDVLEELHWGSPITLSRPKPWHIKLQIRIADRLRPLLAEAGYVITELPFRAVPEYDLRAADVAFVSRARWDEVGDKDLAGVPELVIEILSPSNTKSQLRQYMALCLANGCQEFWAVDHSVETVTVTGKEGRPVAYTKGQAIPIQLFNGPTVPVDEIFGLRS